MDPDLIIGRLYRAVLEAEEGRKSLLGLVASLKSGEVTLERVTVTPTGVIVSAAEQVGDGG